MSPIRLVRLLQLLLFWMARILPLKSIPTTPHHKRKHHHSRPRRLRPCRPPNIRRIKRKPKQRRTKHLRNPIQRVIQRARALIEPREIDVVELVRVKPIRGKEHREQKDDVRVAPESFPETEDLGFPGGVLHEDDAGAVAAHDVFGVDECPGETGAEESEDQERDVCRVAGGG
jgi:hypothetical protein